MNMKSNIGCEFPFWWSSPDQLGNGYCEDEYNNFACHFDLGDCCGPNVNTFSCTNCFCHSDCNGTIELVGDGLCNDELNNPECNFDDGDCCGTCNVISVSLEGNALLAQNIIEGLYYNSSMINDKPSWTSNLQNTLWFTSNGFWYFQDWNFDVALYNYGGKCPHHIQSESWNYFNGILWMNAATNQVNIKCVDGNFFMFYLMIKRFVFQGYFGSEKL